MVKELDFKTAFKYPFNRAQGMLNILWIFVPILGIFALGGYSIRIIKEFLKGKFKELPSFAFSDDLGLGFFMFLKSIPFMIAYFVVLFGVGLIDQTLSSIVNLFVGLFILPVLSINFFKKETVESFFEFSVVKSVFENFGDYIMVLLKSIALGLIFLVMWIVLLGIPAGTFTKNIFFADFYRRNVKN